jgi:hypothetical protein
MEKEVVDAVELKAIMEATSTSPLIVPGTDGERKRVTAATSELAEAGPTHAESG